MRPTLFAIAIVVGVILSGEYRIAEGSHYAYSVEDPENNPNGGITPVLRGIQRQWMINNQALSVCSDWGSAYSSIPAGIRQAISDWEGVLPDTQFSQNCSGSASGQIWFKRRSTNDVGSWPCSAGAWACAPASFPIDPFRQAYYSVGPTIWIDDAYFTYAVDDGWRYIGVHELGHHFGLDEA